MSLILKNGAILTNEELFAIPVNGDGWRVLPDGDRASIGDWARIGDWASIGNEAQIGNEARIGDWARFQKSPLAVQGTRHLVTQHSAGMIAVGCEVHTNEEWLANFREIGKKNGYTEAEIEEYGKILRFVIENGVEVGVVEPSVAAER